jgi:hypothetical protein
MPAKPGFRAPRIKGTKFCPRLPMSGLGSTQQDYAAARV